MERIINLDIELFPEGVYLGTSDDVQGLVVQAATIPEVVEIALDLAPTLMKWHEGSPVRDLRVVEKLRKFEPIDAD